MLNMKQRNFIKKVRVKDENSTPVARAARLRRLRQIADLSRQQLCDKAAIKLPSLKRWELGLYGGLPLDGATKILTTIAQMGISCSMNWLLHGEGSTPQIPELKENGKNNDPITRELTLFKQHYSNSMEHLISDDGMLPLYFPGDWVAGVAYYLHEIKFALNAICILELQTGEILVRKLQQGNKQDTFTLVCSNSQTRMNEPILFNVKLVAAAPIVRAYRAIPTHESNNTR